MQIINEIKETLTSILAGSAIVGSVAFGCADSSTDKHASDKDTSIHAEASTLNTSPTQVEEKNRQEPANPALVSAQRSSSGAQSSSESQSFFTEQEKAFNDSSYNLGFSFLWKDNNTDGKVQLEELVNIPDVFKTSTEILQNAVVLTELANQLPKGLNTIDDIRKIKDNVIEARSVYKKHPTKENKELLRQALVQENLATRQWAPMPVDFSVLSIPEQKVAWQMLYKVAPLAEIIFFQQMDPNNLEYRLDLIKRMDVIDYALFWYSGGPWCLKKKEDKKKDKWKNELCSFHPSFPKPVPNGGHWPPSFREKDLKNLNKDMKESLRSSFVDRYLSKHGLMWTSINENPAYEEHLKKASDIMLQVSKTKGLDLSLTYFLAQRAYEFLDTKNPFPFFGGDLAWIKLISKLDVLVGFYEEYVSPFYLTGMLEMMIGVRDQSYNAVTNDFGLLVPELEQIAAEKLGKDYKIKDFSNTKVPIIVTNNIIIAEGRCGYLAIACKLPNIVPFGEGDLIKIMIIPNNMNARGSLISNPMSVLLMDSSQIERVTFEGSLYAGISHEISHSVGPDGEYITTRGGTVQERLGDYQSPLEEAKADLLGIVLLKYAYDQNKITKLQLEEAVLSLMPHYSRGFSYGIEDSHGKGVIVEFAELYMSGAIVETEDHKYRFNLEMPNFYDKFEDAALKIMQAQKDGDYDTAKDLIENSPSRLPEHLKDNIIPQLKDMPKDVRPWYGPIFSPEVEREMYETARQNK